MAYDLKERSMSEPSASSSDKIQTVGQLKEWLKQFDDHDSVVGAIQGEPRIGMVLCRHAQGRVIIEVPRLREG